MLGVQRVQQILDDPGFHEHVVVKVEHRWSGRLLQQKVALLSDAVNRLAVMPGNGPSPDRNHPSQGLNYLRVLSRFPALVGNDYA